MNCVLLDRASMDTGDLDWSELRSCVKSLKSYDFVDPSQMREILQNADVVVTNKVVLDRKVLSTCKRLKLICVAATGTNNIDRQAAAENGIVVSNARGYATASVVEHAFSMMTSLMRNMGDYQQAATDGRWASSHEFCFLDRSISELSGKCIGIVGYGVLGRAIEKLAIAFGMTVLIAQRPGSLAALEGRVALEDMLPRVDILSLHCPLSESTKNLIDLAMFKRMKPGAILVNTARGGIVNEQDLEQALRIGLIAGAGIDVLSEEPPQSDNILLQQKGLNLLVTPHVAWASREARQRLVAEIVSNINAFTAGEPRNIVNPE